MIHLTIPKRFECLVSISQCCQQLVTIPKRFESAGEQLENNRRTIGGKILTLSEGTEQIDPFL